MPDPAPEVEAAIPVAQRRLAAAWAARNAPAGQFAAAERDLTAARREVDLAQQAVTAAERLRDGPWWAADVSAVPRHAERILFEFIEARFVRGDKLDPDLGKVLDQVLHAACHDTGLEQRLTAQVRAQTERKVREELRQPMFVLPGAAR